MKIEVGGRYIYDYKKATAIVTVLSFDGGNKAKVETKNGQVYEVPVGGLKKRIG